MGKLGDKLGGVGMNLVLGVLALGALVLIWSLVAQWVSDDLPDRDARTRRTDIVQVEVLNGCGVSGLAADMTDFLRRNGFDVLEAGDHDNFEEPETFILDRSGNPGAAQSLARSLGLSEDRIREAIQPDRYLDVSLVIGQDYASIAPFDNND